MAVTTDLPFFSAVKINSLAGDIPPITSIIKSMLGSFTTDCASSVIRLEDMPSRFTEVSRTATFTNSSSAPARDAKSALFATISRATCEPTVPQPSIPTLRVFIGEVSQTYDSARGA